MVKISFLAMPFNEYIAAIAKRQADRGAVARKKREEERIASGFYEKRAAKRRQKSIDRARRYRLENKDKVRAYKESVPLHKRKEHTRRWLEKGGKEKKRQWRNRPDVKILLAVRRRVREWITRKGARKTCKTMDLLGCTKEQLKAYIEGQFKPWMSWANYGKEWHLDHIHPCASFDMRNPEHQKICFHYTNIQPLPILENLKKSNKITVPQLPLRV